MCCYLQDSDPISLLFSGDVCFLRDATSLGCGPPAFIFIIPVLTGFSEHFALLDAGQSRHCDWLAGGVTGRKGQTLTGMSLTCTMLSSLGYLQGMRWNWVYLRDVRNSGTFCFLTFHCWGGTALRGLQLQHCSEWRPEFEGAGWFWLFQELLLRLEASQGPKWKLD